MVEFGAKLSLKDNMYATLQKNLKMQKQFTEQVKRTNDRVKQLAKAKIKPVLDVKDKATAIIKKVKDGLTDVGKKVAKPFVYLKDKASAGLSKVKSVLGSLAKGVTIGIGLAGAGVTALLGGSLSEGANLQQSVGGVETLYKGDAGIVAKNAEMAYKTAGLSANAYMEQVTSFSASLLQSLGGDTQKSATIADMAITDMADNANKFGTDISMIQNAYQGFAKQNYTMLDNLKLGYGGTEEEMKRLLKDAQKLTGVKYNINNLADVYNAIHAIQENMGVTGTTAKEAGSTFSGSLASMKASAQNLLANLSLGGDITGSMTALVSSATTFLADNLAPMVGNIFKALPTALRVGIEQVKPHIMEAGANLLNFLKDGVMNFLPPSMQGLAGSIFDGVGTIFSNLPTIFEKVKTTFNNIVTATEPIRTTLVNIFTQVVGKIGTVVEVVQSHMGTFKKIFEAVVPVVTTILSTAWSIISPIIDLGIIIFDELMKCVDKVFPTIQKVVEKVWSILEPIFGGIAKGIEAVGGALSGIGEFVGNGINTVASWFGFAYGKDRVPYDNYPAVLHAGEKVLTRTQADQYERAMSTRGIQLSETPIRGEQKASTGGNMPEVKVEFNNVTISNMGDLEEVANKTAEVFVNRFRKMAPNMA